jgi:hypothetical protein
MNPKSIFASLTIWLNFLAAIGLTANEILPVVNNPALSKTAIILAVINILLRFKTKQPISLKA